MIREIVTPRDLEETLAWYAARGEPSPAPDWFGRGFTVPHVAAAFLYLTDSRRAYVEDVVTNPACSAEERHVALLELQTHIERVARDAGALYLVGWSHEADIAKRAGQCGYTDIGQYHGFARRLE